MSQRLGVEQIISNIETYLKTDQIYLEGFAHQIPKLVLDKIIYRNRETYESIVSEIKNKRNKKQNKKWFTNTMQIYESEIKKFKENQEKERLANKKKLHTKQKEL